MLSVKWDGYCDGTRDAQGQTWEPGNSNQPGGQLGSYPETEI
jgi:hypothetical protein